MKSPGFGRRAWTLGKTWKKAALIKHRAGKASA